MIVECPAQLIQGVFLAKSNRNSLRLDADYTEDVVGFALESFISLLSFPRYRFSIEPFSRAKERWLGADAKLIGNRISGFRPFYMQFKRPSAYPENSAARIVAERKNLKQEIAPNSLFFSLRKKDPGHSDFQHNILFRLRAHLVNLGIGDATYVCPLFLEGSAYRHHLHLSGLWRWPFFWHRHPFDFNEVQLVSPSGQFNFDQIPVLAGHISIPPHARVTSARHSYSFSESGEGLCFHSPLAVENGAISLAEHLTRQINVFLSENARLVSPRDGDDKLRALKETVSPDLVDRNTEKGQDFVGEWMSWGHYLKSEFDIHQFAFVTNQFINIET